jgi:hypothetical protein
MVHKISAVRGALLIVGAGLLAAGCGGATQPSAGTGSTAAASPAAGAASAAGGGASAAPGTGAASCTGGLTGTEPGVILVVCDGTAKAHVQVGTITKDFADGKCAAADGVWSMTDGVITQYGKYKGPPVDVLSVNNQASGRGTIQLSLGGKTYFVDNASFDLSNDKKAAHLRGKTTPESDAPGTMVTVDVAC